MKNEDFLISIYKPAYARLIELGKKKEDAEKFARYIAVQAAHESAWGTKTAGKNNFFGMKATQNQPGTYVTTHEGAGAKRTKIVDKFIDYETPEIGVRAAVDRLSTKFHAFDGAASPEGYVDSIKKYGYFTDTRDNYLKSMKSTLEGPTMQRAFADPEPKKERISDMYTLPPIIHPADKTRVAKPLVPPFYLGGRLISLELIRKAKEIAKKFRS